MPDNTYVEELIVVSAKGDLHDHIYEQGKVTKPPNTSLPNSLGCSFYYGYVTKFNDSDTGSYDRIIVSTAPLKRGDILTCLKTNNHIVTTDVYYPYSITYHVAVDLRDLTHPQLDMLIQSELKNTEQLFKQIEKLHSEAKNKPYWLPLFRHSNKPSNSTWRIIKTHKEKPHEKPQIITFYDANLKSTEPH